MDVKSHRTLTEPGAGTPVVVQELAGDRAPDVPRADVEVDVDMENDFDGAHLWGAQVTHRCGVEVTEPGYHAFANWDAPSGPEQRADVFLRFWGWLQSVRRLLAYNEDDVRATLAVREALAPGA